MGERVCKRAHSMNGEGVSSTRQKKKLGADLLRRDLGEEEHHVLLALPLQER